MGLLDSDGFWILMGALLLFGTISMFSPTSKVGKQFSSFRGSLEGAFGKGVGYCPFINPYAMTLLSAGDLTISGNHSLCLPIQYVLKETDDSLPLASPHCYTTYSLSVQSQKDDQTNIQISWTDDNGELKSKIVPYDLFFSYVSEIQQGSYDSNKVVQGANIVIDKSTKAAISLLTEKRPMWQCFLIFGLMPFLIIYYLLNDLLNFTMFTSRTRRLIAIFGSFLTIVMGGFASVVFAIANFVGLSTGPSFLIIIFGLALLSVLFAQFSITASSGKAAFNAAEEAMKGALAFKMAGDVMSSNNTNQQNNQNR